MKTISDQQASSPSLPLKDKLESKELKKKFPTSLAILNPFHGQLFL